MAEEERVPLSAEIAAAASFVDGDGRRWSGASQPSERTLYSWASRVAELESQTRGTDARR